MRTGRPYGIASLFVAAGLALAGCQTSAVGTEGSVTDAPARVEPAADGGPAQLILIEEAVLRLGITTEPVAGSDSDLSMPYSAVVYDAEGATWAFVELEPGVYQRESVTISSIDGDQARLSDGPEPSTPVVTVGAPELVGVEAGISGGE